MRLLDALKAYFDPASLAIFLICLVGVIAGVLWFINKTTGRPWRDMIALVGATIIMIACLSVVFSMADAAGQTHLPGRTIFLLLGTFVAWLFNKFVSTPRRR